MCFHYIPSTSGEISFILVMTSDDVLWFSYNGEGVTLTVHAMKTCTLSYDYLIVIYLNTK